MIEQLWNDLISFSEQFIVPDWGALVGLIPILLAALAILVVSWIVYRFATAGPTRRGRRKLPPVAPEGVHMPGPSFAPILVGFGVMMFVFGMVVGGLWLLVGGIVLLVTLLYWGREALRDYDHLPDVHGAAVGALAAPAGAPPAGVHIPAPSFRPLLVAFALTLFVAGMIAGGWALLFGALAVLITGLGWLRDARREFVAVEAADRTGHLDTGGAPPWPTATFAALGLIIAAALLLGSGLLPNSGTGTPAASGAPGGPAAGGGAAGGGVTPAPSVPDADAVIVALNIQFDPTSVTVPAGRPFTIAFDNKEAVPHDVAIRDAAGADLFTGEVVTGPTVKVYDVPALAAGDYSFVCTVHPNMTGTLTAQ